MKLSTILIVILGITIQLLLGIHLLYSDTITTADAQFRKPNFWLNRKDISLISDNSVLGLSSDEFYPINILNTTNYTTTQKDGALNFLTNEGVGVLAFERGEVISIKYDYDSHKGFQIKLLHEGNLISTYSHGNGKSYVEVGDQVEQGDRIMEVGCSGWCSSPRLSFELELNNRKIF